MEILKNLKKITAKSTKRLGRGIGSGVGGHTTGRGAKGDKVRGKTKLTFDGTKIKKGWIKRLPFLRGKHRLNSRSQNVVFSLSQIDKLFKKDETVDSVTLAKRAKLSKLESRAMLKVLSSGEITKIINFKGILVSKEAQKKITAAGGNIE
ncbi:MAG: 50S ribosomal protein L15 [Candidatus Shapirobacteria bacterium]|nr:50S ribosomal protein L15 [Candidatus Shapirobacteria bacterium]